MKIKKKAFLFEWLSTRTHFKTEARRNLVNTRNICWVALLLVRRYAWAARWTVHAKLRCTCTSLLLNAHMHAQKLFFDSQNKVFSRLGWIEHVIDGGLCPHQSLFHARFERNLRNTNIFRQVLTPWTYKDCLIIASRNVSCSEPKKYNSHSVVLLGKQILLPQEIMPFSRNQGTIFGNNVSVCNKSGFCTRKRSSRIA